MVKGFESMLAGSLDLEEPRYITGAEFNPVKNEIDVHVGIRENAVIACPRCGGPTKRYGYEPIERSWRHADCLFYPRYVHCKRPRVKAIPHKERTAKGEVYECNLFTIKDSRFKSDSFLDEVKRSYTDLINIYVKDDNPDAHPLFHSDRGFQYTSHAFHHMLEDAGMTQSMSRVAHCIDNGPMEGFWGILKREEYYGSWQKKSCFFHCPLDGERLKEGQQPRFHPLLPLQKNFPHPLDKTVGIGYNNQCRR